MVRTKNAPWLLAAWITLAVGCSEGESGTNWMPNSERGDAPSPAGSGAGDGDGAASPVSSGPDSSGPGASDGVRPNTTPSGDPTSQPTTGPGTAAGRGETDPTGVWWTEVETIGSETLPWLGMLPGTQIRFVMRVEVAGSAPDNQVTFQFCALQTEWIDPADPNNITTIGFRPDTVASFTESVTLDLGGLSPGSDVPLPALTFHGGIDEAGMDLDDDGDGFPAVTAWVKTLLGLQIEVYEMIKIHASLALTASDDDTLEGSVDFNAEALILSSNNPIIFTGTPVTIVPDSDAVPITVRRLPAGGDCSDIPSTITFTEVPPAPPSLIPPAMTEPAADPTPAPAPAP